MGNIFSDGLNGYGWIILGAIIVQTLLDIISNVLNIKSLNPELPKEFKKVYEAEKYAKSQQYTKDNTRFGLISGGYGLVILLVFWFAGGFNTLDVTLREFKWSSAITGLAYFGLLMAGKSILSLPFSIYGTFVLEEKYGFNRTTKATFIFDRIKGLVLGVLIGAPIMYAVLWFFENTGAYSWLYVWLVIVSFTLIMQYVAPVWIMPLFNKFEPLEDGKLKKSIMDYATSVKFSLTDVSVMDGSKRSNKSNAFFTGFGKNKRIALFDTLIEKQTVPELTAVLAHEIGHYKKKHILKGMIISILQTGILLFLVSLFLTNKGLFDAFFMQNMSVYGGLIFFSMLYSPIDMVLSPIMSLLSRKHEYEADNYAAVTIKNAKPLISALKKLSVDNLSNLTPHNLYVILNYSHPPVLARIQALQKIK